MSRMTRSAVRGILATLMVLLGAVATLMTSPTAASASPIGATELGAVDLGGYCRSQGNVDAVLSGGTAYDWHCRTRDGQNTDLSFTKACQWTYPGELPGSAAFVFDRIDNFYAPASVQCWKASTDEVTAPALDGYCSHHPTGDRAVLTGNTVYDWKCESQSPNGPVYSPVNVLQACQQTKMRNSAVDRFTNFYDPYSWQCRV
ncbi:hypothetical protein ACWT_6140 [Actinoplanes sp. SE50]|nr:hypothetical protein ACPL_6272 [Actinoplanes sp. SE50/110]ATO85555.1 hypothetical protein ACWT_6140 [Actinoplanes sp. SE50]SLM02968.1 extracellular protein [Actinoplanes sp. SE50/110]